MSNDDEIMKAFKKWIERAGTARALSALTGRGVGAGTAERIVNGRYVNKPSNMLRKTLLDVLAEEKAS